MRNRLVAYMIVAMPTVIREIDLPVDPDEAWADVSEEERLSEWLDDDVTLEPWEGGEVRVGERSGVVHEVEEGRRLRFTWSREGERPSEVTFTVVPLESGSRIRVTETGPVAIAPRMAALAYATA